MATSYHQPVEYVPSCKPAFSSGIPQRSPIAMAMGKPAGGVNSPGIPNPEKSKETWDFIGYS